MARPRKITNSLSNLHQTNGVLPQTQSPKPQSVYEILGMRSTNYRQNSFAEYQEFLSNLNLAELQHHSVEIANIIPIDDRRRLVDRLEKEYLRVNARFAPSQNSQAIISPENEESIKRIMNQRV